MMEAQTVPEAVQLPEVEWRIRVMGTSGGAMHSFEHEHHVGGGASLRFLNRSHGACRQAPRMCAGSRNTWRRSNSGAG